MSLGIRVLGAHAVLAPASGKGEACHKTTAVQQPRTALVTFAQITPDRSPPEEISLVLWLAGMN